MFNKKETGHPSELIFDFIFPAGQGNYFEDDIEEFLTKLASLLEMNKKQLSDILSGKEGINISIANKLNTVFRELDAQKLLRMQYEFDRKELESKPRKIGLNKNNP